MLQSQTTLGLTVNLKTDMESASKQVIEALKAQGFGVLTEINIQETFKKKLDVDFQPYKILGACNPVLAHRALTVAPEVGLLLPCNVTLIQMDEDQVQVSAVDPLMMMSVVPNDALKLIAQEARDRLLRALQTLEI
jgi:uncharacterized protein (DUF302 family)